VRFADLRPLRREMNDKLTNDITTRLRRLAVSPVHLSPRDIQLLIDASAEIERLHESIKTIIKEDGVVVSRQRDEIEQLRELAKNAKSIAAMPDYDEEAIREALCHSLLDGRREGLNKGDHRYLMLSTRDVLASSHKSASSD
jgi:hypothetical protein